MKLTAVIGDALPQLVGHLGIFGLSRPCRRQRRIAHLIRSGLAFALGYCGADATLDGYLPHELCCLIERGHGGEEGLMSLPTNTMAHIEKSCLQNRNDGESKVRDKEAIRIWMAVPSICRQSLRSWLAQEHSL